MRATLENLLDERGRLGADRGAPAEQPRRTPFLVRAVRLRHVVGHRRVPTRVIAARMDPEARAALEDLDGRGGEAHVERLVHERIRHRVVVVIDLDVIVDVDARL